MFGQPVLWRDVDKLRRDMDRLFESTLPRWQNQKSTSFPAINVWTNNEKGILVTAELPGVNSEHINISVTADTLTLSGSIPQYQLPDSSQFHRRERQSGEFNRTFQLPYSINSDQVRAEMKNGVLLVNLPRAEAEKPRQITVQAHKN